MHKNAEPSQRQLRVGEQLRHIIAETLQRGHFRHEALLETTQYISVTEVRPSPDLKNATAYIIALGDMDVEEILPALNEAAPYFQKEINRNLNMKFTPRIRFRNDSSFAQAAKIDSILNKIHETGND